MADNSISTVLSLSLHRSPGISRPRETKPGVNLCPSVWCFNPIKPEEESLISSKPNLQDLTFMPLSSPTHTTHHSSVLDLFPVSDLTAKKQRRVEKDNPFVWSFNATKSHQESSVSVKPNLKDFSFSCFFSSTHSKPSSVLNLFPISEDFLADKNCQDYDSSASMGIVPPKKRKRQKICYPKHNMTENCSNSTIVTKKQRVGKKPPTDGQWIKKQLSLSDVNDSSRLLLPKEDIKNYVLPLLDEEKRASCQSTKGLNVKIWDLDTKSEHELSLKQWVTGSFVLVSNWLMEFVKRRSLEEGDCIGLLWDYEHLGFFFHKFNSQ